MNATTTANLASKTCSRCGVEQPVDDFQWKNRARGIRRTWCISCARAYAHEHYIDNIDKYKAKARFRRPVDRARTRILVNEYLATHPCVDCGTADITILEFDHRDPASKRTTVSRLVSNGGGWATVLAEIEKCDVRCASCHRQRTAFQFEWTKTKVLPKPEPRRVRPVPAPVNSDGVRFLKECCWCHWLKPLSEFAFRSSLTRRVSSHCRACHAAYRHEHYLVNRERYFGQARAQTRRNTDDKLRRMREYLIGHPCVDCGATDIAALDFDHVDPTTKEMEVTRVLRRRNWEATEREIAKCVVRCANCHRRRTIGQLADAAA